MASNRTAVPRPNLVPKRFDDFCWVTTSKPPSPYEPVRETHTDCRVKVELPDFVFLQGCGFTNSLPPVDCPENIV